jgi:hypothetical protein
VQWKDFEHDGVPCDLRHLYPRTLQFERLAQGDKPAVIFTVDVIFSMHCFTRELPSGGYYRGLTYSDARETRLFDFERYELSKRLPGIIETLAQRKCFQTGHGNFVTVEVVREDGVSVNYHVFFTASKSDRKGRVNIYVQSAYAPDRKIGTSGKPIRFLVILYNTLNKLPIRS